MYKDAQVYDSLGKRIGKVSKVINSDYIIVTKIGLISDEEYQIPVSCVSHFNSSDDNLSISLNIDESCLKHGFEVISGASGGAIPATHEPDLIPTSKETIRYTVDEMQYGNNPPTKDNNFTNTAPYIRDRLPQDTTFVCDMCTRTFDNQDKLRTHRMSVHNTVIDV